MLAKLEDVFDGSGDSISRNVEETLKEIAMFVPEDEDMLRLLNSVEHGLRLLKETGMQDERFEEDVCWAYDTFVRRYFSEAAE